MNSPMTNARLVLELPCGCRSAVYEGDVVGIPFGRLPLYISEVVGAMEQRGCKCPAVNHTRQAS